MKIKIKVKVSQRFQMNQLKKQFTLSPEDDFIFNSKLFYKVKTHPGFRTMKDFIYYRKTLNSMNKIILVQIT